MNWSQMIEACKTGSFFQPLGSLSLDDRVGRLQWTPLIATESVWQWLRRDGWEEAAIRANDPVLKAVLALLLQRRLLNLETRFRPDGLFGYWEWVMRAAGLTGEHASTVWEKQAETLRSACAEGDLSLPDIVAQEERFVAVLKRAEEMLQKPPPALDWAHLTLTRLLARRQAPAAGRSIAHAYTRIVFAWCGSLPPDLRPAMLVDLELKGQGSGPHLVPERLFADDFRETVKYVAGRIGDRSFHRLEFKEFWVPIALPSGRKMELPDGYLTGQSGGLGILLAQVLANRPLEGRSKGNYYTLPPWVVVAATLDQKANGSAHSVGAIEAKVRLLREEGVRIVVVADDSTQLTEARKALEARPGVRIHVYISSSPRDFAAVLIKTSCAWPAALDNLKQPVVTRRQLITASSTALAVGMLGTGVVMREMSKAETRGTASPAAGQPGSVVQDFVKSKSNYNFVSYTWAQGSAGSGILYTTRAVQGTADRQGYSFLRIFFVNRESEEKVSTYPSNLCIRPQAEKFVGVDRTQQYLKFDARVPPEHERDEFLGDRIQLDETQLDTIQLAIRVKDALGTYWEYADSHDDYIPFVVTKSQAGWQTYTIDLKAKSWKVFPPDGNSKHPANQPDFSEIKGVVVEVGSLNNPGALRRPGPGLGRVDIRAVRLDSKN